MDKEIIKLQNTKAAIKQALVDKGCNPTDEFASYANDIKALQTSGKIIEGTNFTYSTFKELPEHYKSYIEQATDCDFMLAFNSLEGELELNLHNANRAIGMFCNNTNSQYGIYNFTYYNHLTKVILNLDNPLITSSLFSGCGKNLKEVVINGQITAASSMFASCYKLEKVSGNIDISNCTDVSYMFSYCEELKELPKLVFNAVKFACIFQGCKKLESIEEVNVSNSTSNNLYLFGDMYSGSTCSNLRQLTIKGLGTASDNTQSTFKQIPNWGVSSAVYPDAKQTLTDSLITYSFDRATAGYSVHTITLTDTTKAVLTEDEIALITTKGFTIS